VWLSWRINGQQLVGDVDPLQPSNPLLKHVALMPGGWLNNYRRTGVLWAIPAVALTAAIGTALLLRIERPGLAFLTSAITQATTILTAGCALFPFLMPSATHPEQGLTVWDASSSAKTLMIMLVAVIIFLPIVLAYTIWVFRVLRGRITLEDMAKHEDRIY
jgi:cytochrome d ubiquinol oxidase subunit II